MDERQKLQQLFCFDFDCTCKLADFLAKQKSVRNRTWHISQLSHIINIQEYWFERIIMLPESDVDRWEKFEADELSHRAEQAFQKWIDLIGDHEVTLDSPIFFEDEQGLGWMSRIDAICRHLIVHGEYHRAQILLFLKNCDINPPKLDFGGYAQPAVL